MSIADTAGRATHSREGPISHEARGRRYHAPLYDAASRYHNGALGHHQKMLARLSHSALIGLVDADIFKASEQRRAFMPMQTGRAIMLIRFIAANSGFAVASATAISSRRCFLLDFSSSHALHHHFYGRAATPRRPKAPRAKRFSQRKDDFAIII